MKKLNTLALLATFMPTYQTMASSDEVIIHAEQKESRAAVNETISQQNLAAIKTASEASAKLMQFLPEDLPPKQRGDLDLEARMVRIYSLRLSTMYNDWKQNNSVVNREKGLDCVSLILINKELEKFSQKVVNFIKLVDAYPALQVEALLEQRHVMWEAELTTKLHDISK